MNSISNVTAKFIHHFWLIEFFRAQVNLVPSVPSMAKLRVGKQRLLVATVFLATYGAPRFFAGPGQVETMAESIGRSEQPRKNAVIFSRIYMDL